MVIYEELPPKSHHSLLYTNDHPYPYLKPKYKSDTSSCHSASVGTHPAHTSH